MAPLLRRNLLVVVLAALTVAFAAARPAAVRYSLAHTDWGVFILLLALLAASKGMVVSGLADRAALGIVCSFPGGRVGLALLAAAAALSTIATNDGAVVILAPIAASAARLVGVKPVEYLVPVLLGANSGSILTPFGNPQNMIIWQYYGLPIAGFVRASAPTALALTLLAAAYVLITQHPARLGLRLPPVSVNARLAAVSASTLAAVVVLGELHRPLYAVLPVALLQALSPGVQLVDWQLALVLALLFLDSTAATRLLPPLHLQANPLEAYAVALLLSQAVSNVPATIMLAAPGTDWGPLLVGVNVAGYATPVSSLANLVGLRLAQVSWREYVRRTFPYTAAAVAVGLVLTLALT